MLVVVGIKGGKPAIMALQPQRPFSAPRNRLGVGLPPRISGAVHRHDDHGGIIEVGVIIIAILKRPAAGAHAAPLLGPIAGHIQDLTRAQPIQRLVRGGDRGIIARLQHGMRGQCRIPHGADAGLAVSLVILDH